ncbi:MAG: polysaccharide pyruvyl transferase family protein [Candidatus Methanomethylicaceae archaeon]
MNILLINLHSARNEGDRLLLDRTLALLRRAFPAANIVLSANDPDSFVTYQESVVPSLTWWFKRPCEGRSRWVWSSLLMAPFLLAIAVLALRGSCKLVRLLPARQQALLIALSDADFVVAAPGNYFYTSGRLGLALLFVLLNQWLVLVAGKPLYLFPQTIGPLCRSWERRALGHVLAKARIIFLRDIFSVHLLARLPGRPFRAVVVPDLAFATERYADTLGRELLASHGLTVLERPLLGVTVLDWGRLQRSFRQQKAYERAVAEAIDFFVKAYGGQAVLFPQVCGPSVAENDLIPSLRVYEQVRQRDRVLLIGHVPSVEHLISAYGLMDIFLGTRLHSNILAVTQGVPVLAIAYQPKTYGVMQSVGLQSWVVLIETVSADLLQQYLRALWEQREAVRVVIAQMLERIQSEVAWVGEMVHRDFERIAIRR